jgi:hypothetical protein
MTTAAKIGTLNVCGGGGKEGETQEPGDGEHRVEDDRCRGRRLRSP